MPALNKLQYFIAHSSYKNSISRNIAQELLTETVTTFFQFTYG